MGTSVSPQTGKIARSAGTVGLAVFLSRILGLVREQVFAILFGAGYAYDAYVVAYRLPNLLRDLFAEGALSSAFVTVFTDYDQRRGAARTWQLANNVLLSLGLVISAITVVGMFAADFLVGLIAPEFSQVPGKLSLTAHLTVVMFPFLPLISLAAVVMGMLNTKGKFFLPALASSFCNLGSITCGVGLAWLAPYFGYQPIVGMAYGTLFGGLLQLAVQLPLLFKVGYRPQWVLDWRDEGLRRIMRLMAPAVIGLSATQITIFINTFYASSCAQGSVSWLHYAFRLLQFPIGVFGVALSIATLPVVARCAAARDFPGLKAAFVSALNLSLIICIPASVGLALLADPIIALIFQYGRFTAFDTRQTAAALVLYAVGLFAYAGVKIVVPVFYALDDTRFPVIASFMTVAVNFVFINLTLEALQHRAIALSTSLSVILSFLFLCVVLYRKLEGYALGYLGRCLMKIGVAVALMGLAVTVLHPILQTWLGSGLTGRLGSLALTIAAGVAVYALAIYRAGIPEVQELVKKLSSRRSGSGPGGEGSL